MSFLRRQSERNHRRDALFFQFLSSSINLGHTREDTNYLVYDTKKLWLLFLLYGKVAPVTFNMYSQCFKAFVGQGVASL